MAIPTEPSKSDSQAESQPQSSKQSCVFHPQTETRLTCTACESPICTKCIVICEVGMKCKKCTGKMVSHVLQVSWKEYLSGFLAAGALGYVFGWITTEVTLPWGYLGYLLAFLAGKYGGELIHRATRYKMGTTLAMVVLIGLLIGMYPTDLGYTFESLLGLSSSGGLSYMGGDLIQAAIFTFCALMPYFHRK
jgi:hypothetical protein